MSPTGGRRPVPRGVFAIEDQQFLLPDPIALDTSFVVEALLTTQPLHSACSAFLKRIFDSGVAIVTSDLLAVELAESAFAITLKERWGGRWRGHRTDGRSRRPATQRLNHTVMSYEALLSPVNHLPIPVRRVTADARVLMTDFGIASYDAVHATSAIAAGAEAIVTLDTGFALLPSAELAIYTDRSRVASCRNKRPHQHARVAPCATVSK
jgi:predicted nucleic acid-binding protein